jgi:hypothetical protein
MVNSQPRTSGSSPAPGSSAAQLFDLLWESLADVLGTAAAATVLRQAVKRVAAEGNGLAPDVVIVRQDLEYHYRVPDHWRIPADEASLEALRALARELGALLAGLTGPVLVRHLERLDPLRERGITFGGRVTR